MDDPTEPHLEKFPLGRLLTTPGALAALGRSGEDASTYFHRHAAGDWGDLDPDDRKLNEEAVRRGARVISAYRTKAGEELWVVTEADRSSTTACLPEEF